MNLCTEPQTCLDDLGIIPVSRKGASCYRPLLRPQTHHERVATTPSPVTLTPCCSIQQPWHRANADYCHTLLGPTSITSSHINLDVHDRASTANCLYHVSLYADLLLLVAAALLPHCSKVDQTSEPCWCHPRRRQITCFSFHSISYILCHHVLGGLHLPIYRSLLVSCLRHRSTIVLWMCVLLLHRSSGCVVWFSL